MKFAQTNHTRTKSPRRRAFTLVELMLVLAILALLAGIVLPKLTGTKARANKDATKTQLSSFKTSLDMFEADNGHYPKSLNDLVVKPRDVGSDWHQYLEKIPLDPWEHPYIYAFPGRHNPNSYDLSSPGPDGQAGNEDDISNWDK